MLSCNFRAATWAVCGLGFLFFPILLAAAVPQKFSFRSGDHAPSVVPVTASDLFSPARGYGIEKAAGESEAPDPDGFSGKFSVLLEEGNYNITATFKGQQGTSKTTLKAEDRRVMLAPFSAGPGEIVTHTITVNIRTPALAQGGRVRINRRESGPPPIPRWDEKLTLECLGHGPRLQTLQITPNPASLTIFLAGDSTVTEQHAEPYAGWGQMLPLFFPAGTAISNHAESGLSLDSFRGQLRFEKILQSLKPGDYVFIQFGHNDQKEKTPGSGPFTTYKARLKQYLQEIRARNGQPVVVTPMERRRFREGKSYPTLHEFADAARQVAEEEQAPLIDLHASSRLLYDALGESASRLAFVHYPAGTFPGQQKKLEDDTHHNAYGGLQLAKCIVEEIRQKVPALATRLRPGIPPYQPHQPDPPQTFDIPPSPVHAAAKPVGN